TDHGIIPHSNILLAIGAATLLIKAERICGSDFNIWRASCSICGLGALPFWALSCHNCSQVDVWYFWMTLSAILCMIGYCGAFTAAQSRAIASVNKDANASFLTMSQCCGLALCMSMGLWV